jgi:Low molecular weight phosphotyrosine protein phosphatase
MPDTHVPEVLFVCVHNAGRSQMAAALLAHHARFTDNKTDCRLAGTRTPDQGRECHPLGLTPDTNPSIRATYDADEAIATAKLP